MGLSPAPEDMARMGSEMTHALTALNAFLEAQNLDTLWQTLVTYAETLDANLLSYHHHAPDYAPDHVNVTVRTWGFPESWVKSYKDKRQHQTDPITQAFATRIRPIRWSKVDGTLPLSPAQSAYLKDLRSWMKGDGIGLPVFGPSGRNGYVGIGHDQNDLSDWSVVTLNRLHWVAESFHIRWCEIVLMTLPQTFTLDERETLILESMALGMSDEVICGVVGAQLESIHRSIRSLMRKMGVSDRASAVIRGVGAGIVPAASTVV